ncbi:MAG: WD40 repeat domain-containing protein [Bacteroidota bacterium]
MTKVEVNKLATLQGHRDCVYTVTGSNADHLLFSAAGDGMVVLWDLQQPNEGVMVAKLPNSIYALRYVPDHDHLLVGHNYEGIHRLDWQNKTEVASLKLTTAAIFDIQLNGDDAWVATGEGELVVVHLPSWTIRKRLLCSKQSARTIAVNPVTNEVAVGFSDHFIRVFDGSNFALKQEWKAHQNSVFTLQYSLDWKTLLSGSRDARLKAWNVAGYELEKEVVAHLFALNHLIFSPDGKHFVTCSMDKSIKVWDADLRLLKVIDKARHAGHTTSVNKLLWSSFNNQLISASDDRTLSVWDLFFKL